MKRLSSESRFIIGFIMSNIAINKLVFGKNVERRDVAITN
jgi:hypothetical protein